MPSNIGCLVAASHQKMVIGGCQETVDDSSVVQSGAPAEGLYSMDTRVKKCSTSDEE